MPAPIGSKTSIFNLFCFFWYKVHAKNPLLLHSFFSIVCRFLVNDIRQWGDDKKWHKVGGIIKNIYFLIAYPTVIHTKKCDMRESWSNIAILWLRFFFNGFKFLYFPKDKPDELLNLRKDKVMWQWNLHKMLNSLKRLIWNSRLSVTEFNSWKISSFWKRAVKSNFDFISIYLLKVEFWCVGYKGIVSFSIS